MTDTIAELRELGGEGNRRFWSKVDIRGDDECWEWTGAKNGQGYGTFRSADGTKRAHRLALEIRTGITGKCALHSCDNPPCCNPAHLRWGTHADNLEDMIVRGRLKPARGELHRSRTSPESICRGEAHGRAALTKDNVRQIRAHHPYVRGDVLRFAKKFGVSRKSITNARDGETWGND